MNQSKIVEKLKESTTITLYNDEVKKAPMDPNEDLVQKAFVKLCELWNNSDGSRKFLKHIISSFYNVTEKVEEFSEDEKQSGLCRCAILGVRVASLKEIEAGNELYQFGKHVSLPRKEWEKLKELRKTAPIEIRNATLAVKSEKSSKILSAEALWALKYFVDQCTIEHEQEVIDVLNPKPKQKKKKFPRAKTKKGLKGGTLGDMMSPELLDQLKKIGTKKKGGRG